MVDILVSNAEAADFYIASLAELILLKGNVTDEDRRKIGNYVTSDILGYISQHGDVSFANASPKTFAKLLSMLYTGRITSRVTKDLLAEVVFQNSDPEELSCERGLSEQSSPEELSAAIDAVLAEHATVAREYKGGKESSLKFLIGQSMKATKGRADPSILKDLLIEKIFRNF